MWTWVLDSEWLFSLLVRGALLKGLAWFQRSYYCHCVREAGALCLCIKTRESVSNKWCTRSIVFVTLSIIFTIIIIRRNGLVSSSSGHSAGERWSSQNAGVSKASYRLLLCKQVCNCNIIYMVSPASLRRFASDERSRKIIQQRWQLIRITFNTKLTNARQWPRICLLVSLLPLRSMGPARPCINPLALFMNMLIN